MLLGELLQQVRHERCVRFAEREIRGVCADSRQVSEGDLFVCLSGGKNDGHDFAPQAVAAGAAALAVERELDLPVPQIVVQNGRSAMCDGVGLVTAVAAILLRGTKPELSFAVTIAGSVVILLFSIVLLSQTFDIFRQIGEKTGIDSSLIKLMVKVIAIGYLVEFAAGVVEDFGAKSVADKLIFAGKVIIFSVSLPVLQTLLSLIGSFLELV